MCFKNTPLLQIIYDGSGKKTSLLEDTEAVNNFSYCHSSFLSDKIKEMSWHDTYSANLLKFLKSVCSLCSHLS